MLRKLAVLSLILGLAIPALAAGIKITSPVNGFSPGLKWTVQGDCTGIENYPVMARVWYQDPFSFQWVEWDTTHLFNVTWYGPEFCSWETDYTFNLWGTPNLSTYAKIQVWGQIGDATIIVKIR